MRVILPPVPLNEEVRLRSLRALDLLDTEAEDEFQELVRAAALACDVPISLISLIDRDRQWFKANVGLPDVRQTPRELSFCAHAIVRPDELLEVPDATHDARFKDNPSVVEAQGVRFYAGVPLRLQDGTAAGTLCVIDRKPRRLSARQRAILEHLARSVSTAMESRRERRKADLRAATAAALDSRWGLVFEHLQDGFILGEVVRDGEGIPFDWRYIHVNAAWSQMVGIPQDAANGRTIREVLPGIEQAWVDQGIDIVGRQESAQFERQVGALGRWYKGQATWLGGDRFVISFTEITEGRLIRRRQQAMLELTDLLGQDDADKEGMLRKAFGVIARLTDASVVGCGDLRDDGETLDVTVEWVRQPGSSRKGAHWLPDYSSAVLPALRAGKTYVVDDVRKDRAVRTADFEAIEVRSSVNVPILECGELVAVYFVLDRRQRNWNASPGHLGFIEESVQRIHSAVRRRRAEAALRTMNDWLSYLVEDRTRELRRSNADLARKIDELTVVEHALRQSQKMDAVGQLTGGLAHDFNNLLASISSSLQLLRRKIASGRMEDLQRYVDIGMASVERAATLTQRLLAFSRRQSFDPQPADTNRLLRDMHHLLRGAVGRSVAIEFDLAEELWTTRIDAAQLESSVLNLCINARDAMAPHGGRLVIRSGNASLQGDAATRLQLAPGDYVRLCVTDTGSGIDPDILQKIFDPFFTTKPIGQGTGLGLSMVYGFVQQSGGKVQVESRVGEGTTFCLFLPRHAGALDTEPSAAAPAPGNVVGSETLLVVEDEADIRAMVVEWLQECGYHVRQAANGAAALEILGSPTRIDLVLTDMGLPGRVNGRQLADAALQRRPDLPILLMTGYAEQMASGQELVASGMDLMHKPFDLQALAARIRAMLDR